MERSHDSGCRDPRVEVLLLMFMRADSAQGKSQLTVFHGSPKHTNTSGGSTNQCVMHETLGEQARLPLTHLLNRYRVDPTRVILDAFELTKSVGAAPLRLIVCMVVLDASGINAYDPRSLTLVMALTLRGMVRLHTFTM